MLYHLASPFYMLYHILNFTFVFKLEKSFAFCQTRIYLKSGVNKKLLLALATLLQITLLYYIQTNAVEDVCSVVYHLFGISQTTTTTNQTWTDRSKNRKKNRPMWNSPKWNSPLSPFFLGSFHFSVLASMLRVLLIA